MYNRFCGRELTQPHQQRENTMFYIMNASAMTGPKAITVEEVIEHMGTDCTIIVGKREISYGKSSKVFIYGSGQGYDVKVGEVTRYTQDTGNGYKNKGYSLEIENIIEIDKDGNITAHNEIDVDKKRRLWVMK